MLKSGVGTSELSLRGIVKRYGRVAALDDVTLEIGGGEFLTLLGPSGSGKSTLLMALAGFVRPDAGEIRIGGQSLIGIPPHRRNIGMVFQRHALFPHMTVFDNIAYPLRLRREPADGIATKVDEVLSLVQLGGYGARRVDQLSGGQSQRVAVARAIVFSPRMLLMDEPLSALDKNLREQLQIEIRSLHDKLGLTTVYVTHDQREALTMSDRVAVMNHGRIAQVDTPRRLFERPADSFVADFIGETNLVPVRHGPDGPTALDAPLDGIEPLPTGGRQLYLVLRPGMVEIVPEGERSPEFLYFAGTVVRPIYEGESTLLHVDCGGTVLTTRRFVRAADSVGEPVSGEPVTLRLHRRDVLLVPEAGGMTAAPGGAAALARAARIEQLGLLAVAVPALLIVCAFLLLPIGWLFWLSLFDGDGNLTVENYVRLVESRTYLDSFVTTFTVSAVVTLLCVLLGYPLTYCLSELPPRAATLLLIAVVLPYWTSILVRTYAWLVLLQRRGLVNDLLIGAGLIDEPLRLTHNMLGTVIGMTYIMLPFLVLPLYASMRSIDRLYVTAAAGMGASPTRAFWTVFVPLSTPGLAAGGFLVFVLCIGFYVTPAILGGGRVIMMAQQIERSIALYNNWGAASALGVVLLAVTALVLLVAMRAGRAAAARTAQTAAG